MKVQTDNATTLILVLMSIASLVSMVAMVKIDAIVNVDLYRFGLKFSREWANPYWALTGIVFSMGWFIIIGSLVFELRLIIRRRHALPKSESPVPSQQVVRNETSEMEANLHREEEENKMEPTISAVKAEDEPNKNGDSELNKVEATTLANKVETTALVNKVEATAPVTITEGRLKNLYLYLEKLSELADRRRTSKPVEKKKEETALLSGADQEADSKPANEN